MAVINDVVFKRMKIRAMLPEDFKRQIGESRLVRLIRRTMGAAMFSKLHDERSQYFVFFRIARNDVITVAVDKRVSVLIAGEETVHSLAHAIRQLIIGIAGFGRVLLSRIDGPHHLRRKALAGGGQRPRTAVGSRC